MVYFILPAHNREYLIELRPSYKFISPNLVLEHRADNLVHGYRDWDRHCYYNGVIRGIPQSRVAISVCDGLVSYNNFIF